MVEMAALMAFMIVADYYDRFEHNQGCPLVLSH